MEITDLLLDVIEANDGDISIVAETDIIVDLVSEFLVVDEVLIEVLETLEDETEVAIFSIVDDTIVLEDFFAEDGECKEVESDLIILQEGVLDEEEYEDYLDTDDLFILEVEEVEDEVSEFVADLVDDALDYIEETCDEDEFCLGCTLEEVIKEAIEYGYELALDDLGVELEE